MICPKCGHSFKAPGQQAAGKIGGRVRVAKGFSSPAVLAKAMATRRANAQAKREAL